MKEGLEALGFWLFLSVCVGCCTYSCERGADRKLASPGPAWVAP